jgi:hypothetical protein
VKPYKDHPIAENTWIRVFSDNVDPKELHWHRDDCDRVICILNDTDWSFQFDNEVPMKLSRGMEISIKRGVWHRVIKGKTGLSILIDNHKN